MATAPSRTRTEGMPGVKGKNVLVTGGSSGIGQAIAVRFAEHGANVAINYLRPPTRRRTPRSRSTRAFTACARRASATCSSRATSPTRTTSCAWSAMAAEELGGIDVLVNNAGIQISRPSHELSSAHFDKVIAVNLRGSFLCAREAIKQFLDEDRAARSSTSRASTRLIPKPDYLGYSARRAG